MIFTKTENMVTPPTPTDWTGMGVIWGILVGIVSIAWKLINSWFADKKQEREVTAALAKTEKETWIRQVVEGVVDIVLTNKFKSADDKMTDMNGKINTLFEYRESDRKNVDQKFDTVLREIRK
jgi:hypothetical protein